MRCSYPITQARMELDGVYRAVRLTAHQAVSVYVVGDMFGEIGEEVDGCVRILHPVSIDSPEFL